jgi:hypothetical protein
VCWRRRRDANDLGRLRVEAVEPLVVLSPAVGRGETRLLRFDASRRRRSDKSNLVDILGWSADKQRDV